MRRLGLGLSLLLAASCGVDRGIETELAELDEFDRLTLVIPGPRTRAVDVLLVIDDAPSMAGFQATLAANYDSFINVLEAEDVNADYRIGVVDAAGRLGLDSCRGRLEDFEDPEVACLDICPLEPGELEATPEPWIERTTEVTNLPPGVTTIEALRCAGPIGSAGTSQRSVLERVETALLATVDEDQPEHGFLRPDSHLLVVVITDGDDASTTSGGQLRPVEDFRALLEGVRPQRPMEPEPPRTIISLVAPLDEAGEPDEDCGEATPERLLSLAQDGRARVDWMSVSICHHDYSPALEPIAEKIRDQIRPACFPARVVSAAPEGEPFEADCATIEHRGDGTEHELAACLPDGEVPEGQVACVEYLTETERAQECIDEDANVELRLLRAEGQPMARGGFYLATCGIEPEPVEPGNSRPRFRPSRPRSAPSRSLRLFSTRRSSSSWIRPSRARASSTSTADRAMGRARVTSSARRRCSDGGGRPWGLTLSTTWVATRATKRSATRAMSARRRSISSMRAERGMPASTSSAPRLMIRGLGTRKRVPSRRSSPACTARSMVAGVTASSPNFSTSSPTVR